MSKAKILFVDDEANVLQGLQRMLHGLRSEWDMTFADSGAVALAALERGQFDVIVTDMRMPQMNGVQLLKQVRLKHPQTARIILSGHSDKDMLLEAACLAHQFLAKPCDTEMLKAVINRSIILRNLLGSAELKAVFSRLRYVPAIPSIYAKLVQELKVAEPSLKRIGDIISEDPGMTAKVLQLVNSAFFGLPRVVSSPAQAVGLLGLDTIKALALTIQVFEDFKAQGAPGREMDAIWRHSVRVGAYARVIARAEGVDTKMVEEAFIGGLLHDLGKLLFAASLPRECAKVVDEVTGGATLNEAELKHIGTTHGNAGGFLLGLWGLPESLIEAIVFHHNPRQCPYQQFSVLTAVHVADEIEYLSTRFTTSADLSGALLAQAAKSETCEYLKGLDRFHCLEDWITLCLDLQDKFADESGTDHE